jgi:hypothetical protein
MFINEYMIIDKGYSDAAPGMVPAPGAFGRVAARGAAQPQEAILHLMEQETRLMTETKKDSRRRSP